MDTTGIAYGWNYKIASSNLWKMMEEHEYTGKTSKNYACMNIYIYMYIR